MARNRRTEQQIRDDMEDLSTEVALGVGLKGVINSLFRESISETDGFREPLLERMEEAFERALKPYPTTDDTKDLHSEYEVINERTDDIKELVKDIYKFLDVDNSRPYNDFFEVVEEVVEEKVTDAVKNAFQDIGKHFFENVLDDFVSKVVEEINKEPETDAEKIARLEQELAGIYRPEKDV